MSGKRVEINAANIRKKIESDSKKLLSFGLSYLDDALLGIRPNELTCIAGYSGHGKSDLALHIAAHNAIKKKRVFYFALEAYELEMQIRIAYKLAADKYFRDSNRKYFDVSYGRYATNTIDKSFLPYAIWGEEEAERLYGNNLTTFYRDKNFTIVDFLKDFENIDMEADLVVVDHVQFFDKSNLRSSEYEELSKIIKKLNETCNVCGIPIIMVSHLSNPDKKSSKLISSQFDLHGSSNIAKESTQVIIVGRNKEQDENSSPTDCSSLIRVAKSRLGGGLDRYVGLVNYDLTRNSYENKYTVAELIDFDSGLKYLQNEKKPWWATNGS